MMKNIIVSGGGISGLTFASIAARLGMNVTVIERSQDCCRATAGGGIGLWPPSLSVLEQIPGVREELLSYGSWMPNPGFIDSNGKYLAKPSDSFGEAFPVLCLSRDELLKTLHDSCISVSNENNPKFGKIEIINGASVERYHVSTPGEGVSVALSNGSIIHGDIFIAADGIHSHSRNQLLKELGRPEINPLHLNYTYFRANVSIADESVLWHNSSFEAWGFGSNGYPIRFGYVPLKKPQLFWFLAIPTGPDTVTPQMGTTLCDATVKDWLVKLIADWKNPTTDDGKTLVDYKKLISLSSAIIRTDIYKIPKVTTFPWSGHNGRVILVGDSAHATAPNIAQGAGLCIEDSAKLAHLLSLIPKSHLKEGLKSAVDEYEKDRKPRASVVQFLADSIAFVGQLHYRFLTIPRNLFMRFTTYLPFIQQPIFEAVVSYSLGGTLQRRSWIPPALDTSPESKSIAQARGSILGRVLSREDLLSLPKHVRDFKSLRYYGKGVGTVTVERGKSIFIGLIGFFAGLPPNMVAQKFDASVTSINDDLQVWTRVFGVDTPLQTPYSTTHSIKIDKRSKTYLSEGIGGFFDSIVRFVYDIKVKDDKTLHYKSVGVTVFGIWLPLPSFLLPKSEWTETPTEKGWRYDGEITMPIIGRMMRYYGDFEISQYPQVPTPNRAIVAGGTGMIGAEICKSLSLHGWDVVVLTRHPKLNSRFREVAWDGKTAKGWSGLVDSNTVIINLAGENPGARRWTSGTKKKILESRLNAINAVSEAIAEASSRNAAPRAYFQASAAGIVGDSGDKEMLENINLDDLLPDNKHSSYGTQFRIQTCIDIEREATKAVHNTPTKLTLMRIGHVLSDQGGLLPYMNLASLFRGYQLGSGSQYVPWIHIVDVADAVSFMASRPDDFQGPVNLVAPESATNRDFLKTLANVHDRYLCYIPVPSIPLKIAIGDSASIILDSERLIPLKLLKHGYSFNYAGLYRALFTFR